MLINPAAPLAKVYAADTLARWCSRYPGLVLSYHGIEGFHTYESWSKNVTRATAVYVPAKAWAGPGEYVKKHLDFTDTPTEACLLIRGPAGVGKTRFVYETIGAIPGIRNLCLYSSLSGVTLNQPRRVGGQFKTSHCE